MLVVSLTAQTIWELGSRVKNPSEFAVAISDSELRDFGFSESFVFDMWGAVSDAQHGRLHASDKLHQHHHF